MPAYIYGNASDKIFIILLHGGPGNNALDFRTSRSAKELEEKYAIVYWQQRGQGSSEGHFDADDITIDLMTEDLNAVLKVLKYKYGNESRFFLMGHSWGGELGTAFLIKDDNQLQINGWIEVDGAHDIPKINIEAIKMLINVGNEQIELNNNSEKWQDILDYVMQIDTNNINNETGREINRQSHQAERYLLNDNFIQKPEGKTMQDIAIMYQQDWLTGIISACYTYVYNSKFYNEIETTSLTGELNKISIPCLFLWGKYDFVVPSQLGVDAYNLVNTTDKKVVIFEKSGHFPMENQADEFVDNVVTFIESYK
jgi:pimeloyl-ACP methyl ester carboxylesterase